MTSKASLVAASLLVLGVLASPPAADAQRNELYHGPDVSPDGRGNRLHGQPPRGNAGGAVVQGNGISYHNGPVMHGTVNIYFIWYGDWTTQNPGAKAIFEDWAQHIGGSPYFNINTTYGDNTANVSGGVAYNPLANSTTMSATTFGTSLSDSSIYSIVSSALSSHSLPSDTNGVYFVLTARGIAETSGFLSKYCGWHTSDTVGGADIKYSFVGDAGDSSGCSVQFSSSPNGNPSADAMISVMTHELEEAATDPDLNAWYDSAGQENADKCAWNFGTTYTANGAAANVKLGTRDYLIQQNWLNANGGLCAMAWAAVPDFSVAIAPASRTLPSTGGTASYTISSVPSNGFAGTVTYGAVGGLPAGASASAVDANGAFTVTTLSGTAATNYTLSVLATSGALSHTATTALIVSPPPVPSFNLSISPSTQTVTRGGSKTFTVTVTPVNGFNSTVNLTVSGAKTGFTLTFNPTSISGGSGNSTLTASTTSSAKKGNDAFTVTAKSGTITKTVSGSVRIQ